MISFLPKPVLLLTACALIVSSTPAATSQPAVSQKSRLTPRPEETPGRMWELVELSVEKELSTANLAELAVSLARATPTRDPEQLMRRLDLFVRAGDRKQTEGVIRSLSRSSIARKEIYGIPDFLIKNQEWSEARVFLERFPNSEASYQLPVLLQNLNRTSPTVDSDRWLAARARNNLVYWTRERLQYRMSLGTQKQYLGELASNVKKHRRDVQSAEIYLESLMDAGATSDLTWMPEVCAFPLSAQNLQLAERIDMRSPSTAISFAERAVAIPITPNDIVWMRTKSTGMIGADGLPNEKRLRARELGRLMQLYEQTGQHAKSLEVLEEITKDNPHGLPEEYAGIAGEGQSQTGTRVFEDRILAAEKDDQNSYQYWMTRADYFGGRNELTLQNEAYLKALELSSKPDANGYAYYTVARSYISFLNSWKGYTEASAWLQQQLDTHSGNAVFVKAMAAEAIDLARKHADALRLSPGPKAAAEWLHGQLEAAPFTGEYAHALFHELVDLDRNRLYLMSSADELIWKYMAANSELDRGESAPLLEFVRKSDGSIDEAAVARMLKLAANASPTRAQVVGTILLGLHRPDAALQWLEIAAHNLPKAQDRSTMAYYLFGMYITKNDYHSAASILPQEMLSHEELLKAYSDLAVTAAKSGDTAEALRLFRTIVNFNFRLNNPSGYLMRQLLSLGMKDQLIGFYTEMAEQDPNSFIPQLAFTLLN